jgi:dihydrolipoamide dehydrogenase
VNGAEGEETVEADNIIIAAGSTPIMIPIPGHELENVITSKEALELESIPESMAVIGGGVIGLEIGHIYQTLGTKITVIEMLPQILPREDADVAEVMSDTLKSDGMVILTGCQVLSIEKQNDKLKLTYQEKDVEHTIVVDKVLMSVGRKADLSWLGQFPIQTDKSGIVVDQYLRTSAPHIYAIGDVTGKIMLAHVASHQGIVAVRNVMGQQEPMSYRAVPSCLYTSPEAASVGLTEADARKKYGDAVNVSYFEFQMNGKALTMGETAGFVKIITEDQWKEIVGVHIVGPKATELIAEAVLAIRLECTAEELMDTIHAHPTLSEAVMEASAGIFGEAIHTLG